MIKRLTAIALLVCILAAFCPTGVLASNQYYKLTVAITVTPPAAEGEVYTIDCVRWFYEDPKIERSGSTIPSSVVWKNADTNEEVTTFTQGESYFVRVEFHIPDYYNGGVPSLHNLTQRNCQWEICEVGKHRYYVNSLNADGNNKVEVVYTTDPLKYPITGPIEVNIPEPTKGANPTFNPDCNTAGVRIHDVCWEDLTDITILKENTRFKEGHDYRVSFSLGTDGYYYYPCPDIYDPVTPQVNVNGHTAYVKNYVDSSGFDAEYTFGETIPITDVAFDVHLPRVGEVAVCSVTETDERFNVAFDAYIEGGGFFDGVRWKITGGGNTIVPPQFSEGVGYTVSVLLVGDNGYSFDESKVKSVTVNGIRIVKGENGDYGKYNDYVYQIDFFFPALEKLLKGDMDEDGSITVADALAALRIAAKLVAHTVDDLLAGDIDRDDRITVGDALSILRVAAKLASPASLDPPEIVGKWQDGQGNVLIIEPDRILNDNGETVFMSEVKDDIITFYVIGTEYSFSYRFEYKKKENTLVFYYTDSGEVMNTFTRV